MTSKDDIRKNIFEKRDQLSSEYVTQATELIHDKLFEFEGYQKAKNIFIFYSMNKELDTIRIIEHACSHGKTIGIPRTIKMGEMMIHEYKPGDPLVTASFGAEEPTAEAPEMAVEDIDLIIMPCVTCNDKGERVGYGGGFYDRVLADFEGITVLPYFSKLQTLDIPMEEHDQKVDYVITEKSVVHVLE